MSDIKLGVQLYTLRSKIQNFEDTEATFKFLRDLGCNVIQISGIGPLTPEERAGLVKRYDMDVCVTHTSYDRMKTDLDAVINEHRMMGCDCLGIGSMPFQYQGSLEGVRAFISEASEIAGHMKANGCRFAYHNHAFEYEKIDGGRTVMDMLLEETDPDAFFFIPDLAWMHIAGVDPAGELEKMKGRVKVVHFKDYKVDDEMNVFTEIGGGLMDFDNLYKACERLTVPYIVYEQDNGFDDPLEATRVSFDSLKAVASRAGS